MEFKGWEEVEQDVWAKLPINIRATFTAVNPYRVVFLAETEGLEKLKQEEDERTTTTDAEEGVEGDLSGAEDSEAQHGTQSGTDQSAIKGS